MRLDGKTLHKRVYASGGQMGPTTHHSSGTWVTYNGEEHPGGGWQGRMVKPTCRLMLAGLDLCF